MNLRFSLFGPMIVLFFWVGVSYLEMAVVNIYYENQLHDAVEKEKKGMDSLEAYLKLCRKNLGDACLQAGMNLAETASNYQGRYKAEWEARTLKYFKKGCYLESAKSCHAIAIWVDDKEVALKVRSLQKACDLGWIEACQEIKKEDLK